MSGTNSGQISSVVQNLALDSIVHLYKMDTADIGGTEIFYWTPGLLDNPSNDQRCQNPCGANGTTTGWSFAGGSAQLQRVARPKT